MIDGEGDGDGEGEGEREGEREGDRARVSFRFPRKTFFRTKRTPTVVKKRTKNDSREV